MKKNPRILVTIFTHGDEYVGDSVREYCNKLYFDGILPAGGVDVLVANPKAREKWYRKVEKYGLEIARQKEEDFSELSRYTEKDMNRVYPGKSDGCYEERMADKVLGISKKYDIVIDIHSTETGLTDTCIISIDNKENRRVVSILEPKYLVILPEVTGALISHVPCGVAIEYGDNSEETANRIISSLSNLFLVSFFYSEEEEKSRMIGRKSPEVFFQIGEAEKPEGATLEETTKNMKLVEKGTCYAKTKDGEPIIAEESFIPFIFGDKNYEKKFGFMLKKID